MSGKRLFAIVLLAIMMASFVLNPSKEEIQEALKDRITTVLRQELGIKNDDAYKLAMTLYGDKMIQKIINNYTEVDNYYFFSLARVSWQGDKTIIGGGAFKEIRFTKQIDQKLQEIIDTLKKIG